MAGPFGGVTVVEFGQFVSVPFCGQLLADAGARVIKVEPANGDAYRQSQLVAPGESRAFLTRNRGKESISLDLASSAAAEVVSRLTQNCDVVLANLSPAATRRRGLDYETLTLRNPRLVYGRISAYGQVGPEADLPGVDVVIQARSGLMSSLGATQCGTPRHSEVQVSDYTAGMLLFAGVASALYAREHSGRGQEVDVSLLGAALTIQNQSLAHIYGLDEWRRAFVDSALPQLRASNAGPDEVEDVRNGMRPDPPAFTAYYRVFAASDGAVAVGAASPAARDNLFELTGVQPETFATDPTAVNHHLVELFPTRSCDEWIAVLRSAGIPADRVRHFEEMIFDPHVEAEGLVADYEHYAVGRYRGLGVPIRLGATPMRSGAGSPAFGADTGSVLRELGYTDEEIGKLRESRTIPKEDGRLPEAAPAGRRT